MNPNPFHEVIARSNREQQEREARAAEEAATREAERHRLGAIAMEALTGLVLPILEQARQALHQGGRFAELGNGETMEGWPRRSLWLGERRLVFEASITSPAPALVWHVETQPPAKMPLTTPVAELSREEITRLVAEFIERG